MPTALYLKYRPQTFEEISGQEHVTRTLKNALAMDRIAHAYLFTGPRGTGKTSTARILAKAVNCLSTTKPHPCNECVICRAINEERLLDLIELDAASNRGIDNIRELIGKLDFRPTEAKYKFYILDEAHMLTPEANNALLKTLEEPPPHAIFVLATTEPNKVPATITSRCQRFDFRRATLPELTHQLSEIAEKEGLEIEPKAIDLIARQATGSFRDATSLLDQLMAFADGGVTLAQVQALLGAASQETIRAIVASIANHDLAGGVEAISQAVDSGADPRQLSREVVDYLRGVLLSRAGSTSALDLSAETASEMAVAAQLMTPEQSLRAIRLFNQASYELRGTQNTTLPLEMALVESTLTHGTESQPPGPPIRDAGKKQAPPPPSAPAASRSAPAAAKSKTAGTKASTTEPEEIKGKNEAIELSLQSVLEQWSSMLTTLRKSSKSIEALLRDAEPLAVHDRQITIGFFYELHKNRVEQDKHAKPQIEKILSDIYGAPVRVRCVVSPKKQKMKAAQDDPLIRAAINMGGKITDIE